MADSLEAEAKAEADSLAVEKERKKIAKDRLIVGPHSRPLLGTSLPVLRKKDRHPPDRPRSALAHLFPVSSDSLLIVHRALFSPLGVCFPVVFSFLT